MVALQLTDLFAKRAKEVSLSIWGPESEDESLISLVYGFADPTLFPREELIAAAEETLTADIDKALNYGPSYSGLSEMLSERMQRIGIPATPDTVMIGLGSSQLIALLPRVLIEPGDTVIVEAPTFLGAVGNFRRSGARLIGVPVDGEGMQVDQLEETLRELKSQGIRPKFIYTIPTFQNPTGATMTLERRKKLVALAAQYGVLILEDDAYSSLRFQGESLPPLAALDTEGWVIYMGTFSKILAPGLRMGWAWGPKALIDRMEMMKMEGNSGPFLTQVVARFAEDGRLDAHIEELRNGYRERSQIMQRAIDREIPGASYIAPDGGFFIWLRLPEGVTASALSPLAFQRGVEFLEGPRCFADESGDEYIRLAFSYVPMNQIDESIKRLGGAIRALQAGL